jgi:hypothetical protein
VIGESHVSLRRFLLFPFENVAYETRSQRPALENSGEFAETNGHEHVTGLLRKGNSRLAIAIAESRRAARGRFSDFPRIGSENIRSGLRQKGNSAMLDRTRQKSAANGAPAAARSGSAAVVLLVAIVSLVAAAWLIGRSNAAHNRFRVAGSPGRERAAAADTAAIKEPGPPMPAAAENVAWKALFDGKSLTGWKPTLFGGEGEVSVEEGRLILGMGNDLTGITSTRDDLPQSNYEVELEAMRVDGSDFFCGLTFPVKKDSCSLILGGWGGGVCGLSSIDHMDASENATTTYREFENGRWYHVRLRITDGKIEAWLDKEPIVEQDITDRRISVRIEVELSKPFGLASWQTTAALRNIRLRALDGNKGHPETTAPSALESIQGPAN